MFAALFIHNIVITVVGKGHQEDMTASLSHKLGPGSWRFPAPSRVLGMCTALGYSELEYAQGHRLEITMW